MIQVKGVVDSLLRYDFDKRRVVERIHQHIAVISDFSAFHIVFPDHPLLIQPLSGDKKLVQSHEILIHKSIDKGEITEVFTHMEYGFPACACFCVKTIPQNFILNFLKLVRKLSLIGHIFDIIKESHAQGIRIQPHSRHGCYTSVDSGKLNLMASNPVILKKQRFVPVTGPAFIQYLGSDLRLKKQGCVANHLHNQLHPPVLFLINKIRMIHQVLKHIYTTLRSNAFAFDEKRFKLGILSEYV